MRIAFKFSGILFLLASLLLHAVPCLATPEVLPVRPPDRWREVPALMYGQDKADVSESMPDRRWWLGFQDAYLSQYIQEATQNSPTLQIALAKIAQARAQVRQAIGDQLPHLSAGVNGGQANLPGNLSNNLGGSQGQQGTGNIHQIDFLSVLGIASYEADLWGKYWDTTNSARKEFHAQEQDMRAAEILLQCEVATAYFNLLRVEALYDFTDHIVDKMNEIMALDVALYQNGLETSDTLLRLERDIAAQELDLDQYKEQKSAYAHELSTLTGLPPQTFEQTPHNRMEQVCTPVMLQTGIPLAMISQRPDVMAQELRLQRSNIDVRVARKQFLPTIRFSDLFGLTTVKLGSLINGSSFLNLILGSVSQPIFQGGKLVANLRLEQARKREQVETYRQTILTALKEVEDSLSNLLKSYEDEEKNEIQVDTSQKTVALAQAMYRNGLQTKLDLLRAENELLLRESQMTQSKSDQLIGVVSLYKALGGGY